jgi:hypothetical protein
MSKQHLPNSRVKLPFFVLCAALYVAAIIKGFLVPVFAVALVLVLPIIWRVAAGRNPRWLQGPLDRWEAKRKEECR